MARPLVGTTTERLYARLPEFIRQADATQGTGGDYPLLRYLSLVVDQAAEVEDALDAFDYRLPSEGGGYVLRRGPAVGTDGRPILWIESTETSTLVDPAVAEREWLMWIGRLVGVNVTPVLTEAEARDLVGYASQGQKAGTKVAIADAARTALTGTKHVEVYDHSVSAPGDGGVWDILLVTRLSETPDVEGVLATVARKGAKPAGAVLHHNAYDTAWDTVTTKYPTWAALEAAGSWNRIMEAGA